MFSVPFKMTTKNCGRVMVWVCRHSRWANNQHSRLSTIYTL